MRQRVSLVVAAIAFGLVATANAGGYRFGISDQAYYEPAIAKLIDPALFPHDAALLDVQSRFLGSVHLIAAISRLTHIGLPALFLAIYIVTMAGLFAAAVALARRLGLSWWAVAGLLVLATLRHRIAKTGANSLEGYMHPRMLAFACGLASCAALASLRPLRASLWTALAAVMHPTTGLWFGIVLVAGAAVARPAWRRGLALIVVVVVVAGVWLITSGPLTGRAITMDAEWLSVLTEKDYLFPTAWPAYAWLINLAYPVVIALAYRARVRRGVVHPGERALVAGVMALVAVFLVSVPLTSARVALVVQLQINRIFWIADFVAAVYVAWWLIDVAGARARFGIVAVLAAIAIARGGYVLRVEANRQFAQATLPQTTWMDALAWLRAQPADWFVLADPGHAWKYGVSVRVGAHRDTLLESGKDSSMAMYDRNVARRVKDRTVALADFDRIDASRARALAVRYHLDVLVDRRGLALDLPVLYQNADFAVYDLR